MTITDTRYNRYNEISHGKLNSEGVRAMRKNANEIQLCVYRKGKGNTVRVYTEAYLLRILSDFYADHGIRVNALKYMTNGCVAGDILRFTLEEGANYLYALLQKKEWVAAFELYVNRRGLVLTFVSKDQFNACNKLC